MPTRLSRPDRALLFAAGSVLVAIVLVANLLVGSADSGEDNASTYSAASGGAKAAFLLLPKLGYQVSRWERPPADLSDPASTLLILAEPSDAPTGEDRRAIQRYLEHGGRVVATGSTGSLFLSTTAAPDPLRGLEWHRAAASALSPITTAAPEITIAPRASWRGGTPMALTLYRYEDAAVVVAVQQGAGEALWWASATPLTNAGVTEPGNLEFLLASLGPPQTRRVLFDEYFHGGRPSLAGEVLNSPVKWLLVQLGLAALVIMLTHSRRHGPILVPPMESRLVPLEFVRTLGSLYERAGGASIAVDAAYRRFRFWLTRRLGVPTTTPPEGLELAVRHRWPANADSLAETLRACEAAAGDESLGARRALALIRSLSARAKSLDLFPSSSALRDEESL